MKRLLGITLLLVIVVSIVAQGLVPSNVYACSCAEPLPVQTAANGAEAVFAGRAVDTKEIKNLSGYVSKAVLFEVSRAWKGGNESQIVIYTGTGGGNCGYHFEPGKQYLVYAYNSSMYGTQEQLTTTICNRTTEIAYAQGDLDALGEGTVPSKQIDLESTFNPNQRGVWVWVAGAALLVLVVIIAATRRRARRGW